MLISLPQTAAKEELQRQLPHILKTLWYLNQAMQLRVKIREEVLHQPETRRQKNKPNITKAKKTLEKKFLGHKKY